MLKIYHAPRTRGFRAIWLCEELEIPYEIVAVDMASPYRKGPEYRLLNPLGKVPALIDGDLIMFESGAINQYVLDCYGKGKLQPATGSAEHAIYLQWCWYAEATFSRPLGEIVNHKREFAGSPLPAVIDEMKSRARACAQVLGTALNGKTWILGETFSGADIMLGLTLRAYLRLMDEDFPDSVKPYWERVTQRPAYKRAIEAETSTAA
ncbi:MAG: glutathione S-transferase family protein [Burkholderiales bacterium]|jgi:glutathione S-transferase